MVGVPPRIWKHCSLATSAGQAARSAVSMRWDRCLIHHISFDTTLQKKKKKKSFVVVTLLLLILSLNVCEIILRDIYKGLLARCASVGLASTFDRRGRPLWVKNINQYQGRVSGQRADVACLPWTSISLSFLSEFTRSHLCLFYQCHWWSEGRTGTRCLIKSVDPTDSVFSSFTHIDISGLL